MSKKIVTMIYGFVLIMMIATAYLVATDVIIPNNVVLVAALVISTVAAIIADIRFLHPRKSLEAA